MSSYGSFSSPMAQIEGAGSPFDTRQAQKRGQHILGMADDQPVADPGRAEQRARNGVGTAIDATSRAGRLTTEAASTTVQASQQAAGRARQAAEEAGTSALETAQAQRQRMEEAIHKAALKGDEIAAGAQQRAVQAGEAAQQRASGLMGTVREATLTTAQQSRELWDSMQQRALDTMREVVHSGQERVQQVTGYSPRKPRQGPAPTATQALQDAAGDSAAVVADIANRIYLKLREVLETAVGAAALTKDKLEQLAELAVGAAALAVLQTGHAAQQAAKVGVGAAAIGAEKTQQAAEAAAGKAVEAIKSSPERAQELASFSRELVAEVVHLLQERAHQVAPGATRKAEEVGGEAKGVVEDVQRLIRQKAEKYGLTEQEAAQQLLQNMMRSAPQFTLEVVSDVGSLLADKAEQIAPRPVGAARRQLHNLRAVPRYTREIVVEVLSLVEDKGNQVAPGLTHNVKVLVQFLDECGNATLAFVGSIPGRLATAPQDAAALLLEVLLLLRDKAAQLGGFLVFAVQHPGEVAGILVDTAKRATHQVLYWYSAGTIFAYSLTVAGMQLAAEIARQATSRALFLFSAGAIFAYSLTVANTQLAVQLARQIASRALFLYAAGAVFAYSFTAAGTQLAVLLARKGAFLSVAGGYLAYGISFAGSELARQITIQLVHSASQLGASVTVFGWAAGSAVARVTAQKTLELLKREASLAHQAAMLAVELLKEARSQVKPMGQNAVAAGYLEYGASGAVVLSAPLIAYKATEIGVSLSLLGPRLGWWATKKTLALEYNLTRAIVLSGAQVAGSLYGAALQALDFQSPTPVSRRAGEVRSPPHPQPLDDRIRKQASQAGDKPQAFSHSEHKHLEYGRHELDQGGRQYENAVGSSHASVEHSIEEGQPGVGIRVNGPKHTKMSKAGFQGWY